MTSFQSINSARRDKGDLESGRGLGTAPQQCPEPAAPAAATIAHAGGLFPAQEVEENAI